MMKTYIVLKPIHSFWLLCLLSLSGACQKVRLPDEVKTIEEAYQVIVGEWEWERTEIHHRGQDIPVYETPETENRAVRMVFMKNLKLSSIETIDKVSTHSDYEYSVLFNPSGSDGEFLLKLTDMNTQDVRQPWFRFKNKNTIVFYNGSLSSASYYIRR